MKGLFINKVPKGENQDLENKIISQAVTDSIPDWDAICD